MIQAMRNQMIERTAGSTRVTKPKAGIIDSESESDEESSNLHKTRK